MTQFRAFFSRASARPFFAASIPVTFLTVISWGIAIADTWSSPLSPRGMQLDRTAVIALTPTCAFLWAMAFVRSRFLAVLRDRVVLYLADAVIASRPAAPKTARPPKKTLPFPVVEAVRER